MGDFQNSFIWRIALLKWNGFWKPHLGNRSKRKLKKPKDWPETQYYCSSAASVRLPPRLLPVSRLILPLCSWQRSWLTQLVHNGLSLVGWAFSYWVSTDMDRMVHGAMCPPTPAHPSQRGHGEEKWVRETVSFRMGEWREHGSWLTCTGQALGESSVKVELEDGFQGGVKLL